MLFCLHTGTYTHTMIKLPVARVCVYVYEGKIIIEARCNFFPSKSCAFSYAMRQIEILHGGLLYNVDRFHGELAPGGNVDTNYRA